MIQMAPNLLQCERTRFIHTADASQDSIFLKLLNKPSEESALAYLAFSTQEVFQRRVSANAV